MNPGIAVGLIVLLVATVAAWYVYEGRWDRALFTEHGGQICRNGSAQDAASFLQTHPLAQVLDVRSAAEFRAGALPNAIHLSFGDPAFKSNLGQLDSQHPVLVYCAGGYRSRKAVKLLRKHGFNHIQHLHRGYYSWKLAGLPIDQPSVS